MSKEIINVNRLNYKVGKKYLLRDINWKIKRGENWIVFGLNGCGKTTLLSIISGYRGYVQGEVFVFGTKEITLKERKRIAFVSSSFFDKIYSSEAVLNIVLSGKFATFGVEYDIDDSDLLRAKELLTEFNVGKFIDARYDALSKGERQNVLLARAMMNNAEVLILDEPCSGLDVKARNEMLHKIELWASNPELTVIYVTHHTDEILDVFDHMLLMKNSRVYRQCVTEEMLDVQLFDAFIASC